MSGRLLGDAGGGLCECAVEGDADDWDDSQEGSGSSAAEVEVWCQNVPGEEEADVVALVYCAEGVEDVGEDVAGEVDVAEEVGN